MSLGTVYVGLLALGTVYALLSTVLGWIADHGGDVHVDHAGHLDASQPHPISGTTVATFITGFGGGGTVAHYLLEWSTLGGLLTAAASGAALAAAAFFVLDLLFSQTQAGAEFGADDLRGRDAEVITPIPADGLGEIAYLIKGQRERSGARVADGAAVPKGALVVIEAVVGAVAIVRRPPESRE